MEGQFLTISDRKRRHYLNREKGETNNVNGSEYCVMYVVKRKGWNDERCSIKLNHVCTK